MREYGKRAWFIPDGEIPYKDKKGLYAHEAIIITNPNKVEAKINFTVYFRDKEPIEDIKIILKGERMIDIHMNNIEEIPINIPEGKPYSLKIESNIGIIVQHSRLISIKGNFTVFTTIAYSQDRSA